MNSTILWIQNAFGPNFFCSKIFFYTKVFEPEYFLTQIILDQIYLSGSKEFFWQNIFWATVYLDKKNWLQIFRINYFVLKSKWTQNFLRPNSDHMFFGFKITWIICPNIMLLNSNIRWIWCSCVGRSYKVSTLSRDEWPSDFLPS